MSRQACDREHFFAAVFGGGPAGAQCALWLKHLGVPAILFEKSSQVGGQQNIAPDPLSNHYVVSSSGMRASEIAGAIQENLSRHGVPFLCGAEANVVGDDGEWFHIEARTAHGLHHAYARNLVLSTGSIQRAGNFETSETVFIGSADPRIRSGHFFEGKRVAVLGGGDNAMESYAFLKLQKPRAVKVFARSVRAGEKHLSAIDPADLSEGGYDCFVSADGNGHVITSHDDPYSRSIFDCLVVNYGVESVCVLPPHLDPARNVRGFIVADDRCVTDNPRILAIGEATQRIHPCVATAMADGTIAAKTLEAAFARLSS